MTRANVGWIALLAGLHLLLQWDKPPHVDDALHLMTARSVLADPLRPICTMVHWGPTPTPLYRTTVNPPLLAYQQAIILAAFGERLPALHALTIAYVLLAGLATLDLARRFTRHPMFATALLMLTPSLLPQTNLMLDAPAMGLFAAAAAAWVRGVDQSNRRWCLAGGLLAGAALLTKYNSIVLLPLLAIYALLRRRPGALPWLAVPPAILAAWCLHNWLFLPGGAIHLVESVRYFKGDGWPPFQWLRQPLLAWGCSFLFLPALGIPWLLRQRPTRPAVALGCFALLIWLVEVLIIAGPRTAEGGLVHRIGSALHVWLLAPGVREARPQLSNLWVEDLVFSANGLLLGCFVLHRLLTRFEGFGATDVRKSAAADDLFLLAWIGGMTLFNAWFSPHQAPRYYFPAFPAAAILLIRAWEASNDSADLNRLRGSRWAAWPVALSLLLQAGIGICLAGSDRAYAMASRDAVRRVINDARWSGGPIGYIGHWGFQHFALRHSGLYAIDFSAPPPPVGAAIVIVPDADGVQLPEYMTAGRYRNTDGGMEPIAFEIVDQWDYPHTWPLQTIDVRRGLLLYGPGYLRGQPPYGHARPRMHPVNVVRRVK